MVVQTLTDLVTHLVTGSAIRAGGVHNVCAKAPDGVQPYSDQVIGWIKWGVIVTLIGCGFVSTALLVAGKFGSMGRTAQIGAGGLLWTVVGAIAFVTIYGILKAIIGNGC